jgi:hypothetical protein
MITATLKDHVLTTLCQNCKPEKFCSFNPSNIVDIDFESLNAILNQFQRLGLIEDLNSRRDTISLILRLDAFDLYRFGGFTTKEVLVKASLEKLQLEIDSLKKSFPEKTETFTTILANMATIATFFLPK